ncbi:MAG TPA: hypothetical protein VIY27_07975 [Myxococcota bacterium]
MTLDVFANLVAIAINLGVGLRLLQRGRARDEVPERLLGLALTFDGVEWLLWLLAAYTPAAGTPLGNALGFICRGGICASLICLLAFNRRVFHPTSSGARLAVLVASTAMLVGWAATGLIADWDGYRTDLPWVWLELGAQCFAYAWTLFESGRYYGRLRRRLAHGLSDPVLTNRLLLWSCYAAAMLTSHLCLVAAQSAANASGSYPALYDALQAGLTLAACAALWLAFFAPEAYRSWLRSAPSAQPR